MANTLRNHSCALLHKHPRPLLTRGVCRSGTPTSTSLVPAPATGRDPVIGCEQRNEQNEHTLAPLWLAHRPLSRVCANHHGLIRKYHLVMCRRCFRERAEEIGFQKVSVFEGGSEGLRWCQAHWAQRQRVSHSLLPVPVCMLQLRGLCRGGGAAINSTRENRIPRLPCPSLTPLAAPIKHFPPSPLFAASRRLFHGLPCRVTAPRTVVDQ
jgi:hypothetical protein